MAGADVTVRCSRCRTQLTTQVRVVDAAMLRRTGQGASLTSGWLVIDPEPVTLRRGRQDGRRWLEEVVTIVEAGSLVVNPDDLLPGATTEIGSTRGCCGLNGADGENQACAGCGLTIGRIWTECWTQHEMRFNPRAVRTTPQAH